MADELFKSDLYFEGDALVHKTSQPTEDIILERNKRLRRHEGVINDLGKHGEGGSWGRQVASIPMILYSKAIKDGFDLNNKDGSIANKEMMRFLQSPMGKACLVRDKV